MSAFEQLMLSDVRTYSLTAKVHVLGGQACARSLLLGHMISFCHDGPKTLSMHFDACRVRQALAHLQVLFVGSTNHRGDLEKRALRLPDLRSRHHVGNRSRKTRAGVQNDGLIS